MATIKAYTNLEQSKKLAEILPAESADMGWYYSCNPQAARNQMWLGTKAENADIPCWSLAALISALPKIQGGKPIIALDDNYITYPHIRDLHTKADNLVDACYEMILKLNELNLL